MINCYCNMNTGTFNFKFSEDIQYFSDIIILLRENYHCTYNKVIHEWFTQKALVAQSIILDLKAYDDVFISKEDEELIENMIYPKDFSYKNIKKQINNEWLKKFPCIIGKSPFENYQMDTIRFSLNRNRAIISLAPGTGKSYIMEAIISSLKDIGNKKILWVNRLEGQTTQYYKILKFLSDFYNEEDVSIVETNNREIEDYFNKKVIITNYTSLRLSNEYYYHIKNKKHKKGSKPGKDYIDFSKWGKPEDLILILDETQSICNYSSLQSQVIQFHKNYFDTRYLMSGSIGYKILDYFALCKVLIPESVPYSFSEFRDYLSVRGTYGKELIPERVKKFKEKVIDKIQISYGEEVLDLKPFIEEEVFIDMSPKMRKMYKDFVDDKVNVIEHKKDSVNISTIEANFGSLLLFTSDPILLNFPNWKFTENPKIDYLKSMLERYIDDEGRKVVVWSNHPMVINELGKVFNKYDPIIIHGDESTSVKRKMRDKLIQDFRTNNNKHLLICSYVLNSSIDLYEATREVYWDNITDNDKRDQSKKRLWRLGQLESVKSHYFLFDKSIDIYCYYEILCRKNKVRNLLMEKNKLSLEDYATVFNAKAQYYWKDTD